MDIIKEAKDILVLQNSDEKRDRLEQLNDIFEYSNAGLEQKELREGLQLLLGAALQEEDKQAKESFFHTIHSAIVHRNVDDLINWDTLASSLSSLDKELLAYAFTMLGSSTQAKSLQVLEPYTYSTDPEIRSWASEAINDLKLSLPSD